MLLCHKCCPDIEWQASEDADQLPIGPANPFEYMDVPQLEPVGPVGDFDSITECDIDSMANCNFAFVNDTWLPAPLVQRHHIAGAT